MTTGMNRTIHADIAAVIFGFCVCPLLAVPPERSAPHTKSKKDWPGTDRRLVEDRLLSEMELLLG